MGEHLDKRDLTRASLPESSDFPLAVQACGLLREAFESSQPMTLDCLLITPATTDRPGLCTKSRIHTLRLAPVHPRAARNDTIPRNSTFDCDLLRRGDDFSAGQRGPSPTLRCAPPTPTRLSACTCPFVQAAQSHGCADICGRPKHRLLVDGYPHDGRCCPSIHRFE